MIKSLLIIAIASLSGMAWAAEDCYVKNLPLTAAHPFRSPEIHIGDGNHVESFSQGALTLVCRTVLDRIVDLTIRKKCNFDWVDLKAQFVDCNNGPNATRDYFAEAEAKVKNAPKQDTGGQPSKDAEALKKCHNAVEFFQDGGGAGEDMSALDTHQKNEIVKLAEALKSNGKAAPQNDDLSECRTTLGAIKHILPPADSGLKVQRLNNIVDSGLAPAAGR